MVTTLYLIRHGETEGSETKRYKGSIDVPLSENGIRQVELAAAFVADQVKSSQRSRQLSYLRDIHRASSDSAGEAEGLKAVYTSDLSRAVKSGEIIAAPHRIGTVSLPELRERNFGIWEGMSFAEIRDQYPEEFNAWADNPMQYSPIGGESTLDMSKRVIAALEGVLSANAGQVVAIVAHGGVNRIILCHVLGMPLEHIFRIEQDNAAINIIEFWDKYPVVKLLNGISHG